jgi:hypothetical protein
VCFFCKIGRKGEKERREGEWEKEGRGREESEDRSVGIARGTAMSEKERNKTREESAHRNFVRDSVQKICGRGATQKMYGEREARKEGEKG